MTIKAYMHELGSAAKLAAKRLALSDLSRRNDALKAIATAVNTSRQDILEANEQDLVVIELRRQVCDKVANLASIIVNA